MAAISHHTALTAVKQGNLVPIKAKDKMRGEKFLVEKFHNHFIKIIEKSSKSAHNSVGNPSNSDHDKCALQNIVLCYKNYPSII